MTTPRASIGRRKVRREKNESQSEKKINEQNSIEKNHTSKTKKRFVTSLCSKEVQMNGGTERGLHKV